MNGTPNDPRQEMLAELSSKLIEIKTQLANGWTLTFSISDTGFDDLVDLISAGNVSLHEVIGEVETFTKHVTEVTNVFGLPMAGDRFVTQFDDHFAISGRQFYVDDKLILIEFDYDEDLRSHLVDEEDDED